jgi:hypothetical protein
MPDFEDSMKPPWQNVMAGIENLVGAATGTLTIAKLSAAGKILKRYSLHSDDIPLLMVRCRGLYLDESNLRVDNAPISGGFLDLVLSVFHTAGILIWQGGALRSKSSLQQTSLPETCCSRSMCHPARPCCLLRQRRDQPRHGVSVPKDTSSPRRLG